MNWWAPKVLAGLTLQIHGPGGLDLDGSLRASGSLRKQPQLLSICQALTAHEGHVRRTCQKSESRRVILCVPIQLKIEAAPGTSVYCQGDEYLYHVTDGLVHHYSLKMAALRMYLWELPAPVWAGNGGGHQPALLVQLTARGVISPLTCQHLHLSGWA